jgi:ParB family chromosome partitioning protein
VERVSRRKGLGKGLGALIPTTEAIETAGSEGEGRVVLIPISRIRPNPHQPRQHFSQDRLLELSESIKQHGLLQPILVRQADGFYELVAGERRFRAAQMAGLEVVPAIVRTFDSRASLAVALIENLQREDLNPIEEALAYQRLQREFGLTQAEIAEQVGKSRSAVANSLRLLGLPAELQAEIARGSLSAGHARALLTVTDPEEQQRLARSLLEGKASVREAERLSRRASPAETRDADYRAAEEALRRALGLQVRLHPRSDGSGTLEIRYPSIDALNQVLERLGVSL